jgi:hypothetical protein
MRSYLSRFFVVLTVGHLTLLSIVEGLAQGLPEPDLVLYGIIKNVRSNANLRIGHGNLTWVFQPTAGGASLTAQCSVTNINEYYSYILRIPCETPVPGFASSSNTIPLTSAGMAFNRSQATWNGNPLVFVQPSQTSTSFGATDRGRIERVDLNISMPIVFDANGLPVDWELMYFGRTGIDPLADPDGDGMNTLTEYRAGTNPNSLLSGLRITEILPEGGGIRLKWTSALFKSYALQHSTSLAGGFTDVQTGLNATAPTNTFLDLSPLGSGPRFYRIRLEDDSPLGTAFRLLNLRPDAFGGLRVEWSSESSKTYAVQRSSNLSTGFADIQINLGATPPVNSYRDDGATGFGPYFYRLRTQP